MQQPAELETGQQDPRAGQRHEHAFKDPRFRLGAEEIRVLRECNRESLYYRCIPIGAVAMISTHFAVKAGYLRPSAKYGSLWKVLGAGLVGYILGKASYREKCEEKLMALNTPFAEQLRRRKGRYSPFSGDPSSLQSNESTEFAYSDINKQEKGVWEIDDDKNIKYGGLDDSHRPSLDSSDVLLEDNQTAQPSTTYDDLRKQNRADYEFRRSAAYQRHEPFTPRRPSRADNATENVTRTNEYGDKLE